MPLDLIVQIGLAGDFARISYFVVDAFSSVRNTGIGTLMEEYWANARLHDRGAL